MTDEPATSTRVLLLPPTRRDGDAIGRILCGSDVDCCRCETLAELVAELDAGAGTVVISEECLSEESEALRAALAQQPVWSDLPVIVLSRSGAESPLLARKIGQLGNVSVLERPVRVSTLLSVVRSALRARRRQYEVRDHLAARERAAADLKRSRQQLAIVVRGANVGVWYCDLPFHELTWDETVKTHFHLPADALVTIDTFYERLHPDDRERTRQAIDASIANRKPYEIEYRTVSEDGRNTHWIRAIGRGFYDAEGEPVRFDGITLDVTSRRLAEERLREESNIVDIINRVGRSVAAELDLDKLAQTVTDATTELTGAQFGAFFYNKVDATGESYTLYSLSGVSAERFQGFPMPRATDLFGPTFRGEGIVRLADVTADPRYGRNQPHRGMPAGHLPVRSYLAVPVKSRNGEVLGGLFFGHSDVGVFQERSERIVAGIAAQAAVAIDNAQLYQAVRDADRRKDEFLAMLAHELRNPLAPVRTGLELLSLQGVEHESVQVMRDQVDHLVRLVDDLLDVSRIMRGKIQLRKESVDLAGITKKAIATCRPQITAHGHELHLDLPEGPIWIDADAVRMAQVISNLLNNAVKYTGDGGHIRLRLAREDGHAKLSIRDNGVGIDAELLPHVFELFTQADRSLERSQGGLGIGLTLVKTLVELHGGRVGASSEGQDRGSEFLITLPVSSPPRPEDVARTDGAPAARRKILIVDDNVGTTRIQSLLMAKLGDHEVRTAHDGLSALRAAEEFLPDLILLDIGLPQMSGYDVARNLRDKPEFRGTTIVALTGYGTEEDRRRSAASGFDLHLVKPPSLDAFRQVLRHTRSVEKS